MTPAELHDTAAGAVNRFVFAFVSLCVFAFVFSFVFVFYDRIMQAVPGTLHHLFN